LCHIPTGHDPRIADPLGMSFKEPIPALSNVMDTKDMHHHNADVVSAQDVAIGLS
jgi:hypothetical protein